jgi:site-specific recombinase XerD
MAKSHLKLVTPTTKKRTVTPRRLPNAELRTREYLTDVEVGRLQKAASNNRWAHRDATMILVAYRHDLRASELADLDVERSPRGKIPLARETRARKVLLFRPSLACSY